MFRLAEATSNRSSPNSDNDSLGCGQIDKTGFLVLVSKLRSSILWPPVALARSDGVQLLDCFKIRHAVVAVSKSAGFPSAKEKLEEYVQRGFAEKAFGNLFHVKDSLQNPPVGQMLYGSSSRRF